MVKATKTLVSSVPASGLPASSEAAHGRESHDSVSRIRWDRVEAARARLAAGQIPLSPGDLADALLRAAARERLCRT